MNLAFFKNKQVLIAIGAGLIILSLIALFSPKKSVSPTGTATSPTGVSQLRGALSNFSLSNTPKTSFDLELESKLPLYLESFPTSVGINTSINLYRTEGDPTRTMHVEIFGLSYLNSEADPEKNPNVAAFQESYGKAMEMIEGQNIDPDRLIFIYSDEEYIQTTTEIWVSTLKLSP